MDDQDYGQEMEITVERSYGGYGRRAAWAIAGVLVVCCLVLGAVFGLQYIQTHYNITNIYVTGNSHYTDAEIIDMVMTKPLDHNSLYLSMHYRDRSVEGIPFIEKMDVSIVSEDTVRINVYEKAIAGYIRYLGRCMYFDRDGIIVESSFIETPGIPQVMGLSFDHVVLYEKLPVENEAVFAQILDVTKLLAKYELTADRLFFDSDYDLYLYFDDVEVVIGSRDQIDEKIIRLRYILPSLEGRCGLLDLHDVDGTGGDITFLERN